MSEGVEILISKYFYAYTGFLNLEPGVEIPKIANFYAFSFGGPFKTGIYI